MEKPKKLSEQRREEEVGEQQGESGGEGVQLDEDEIPETTKIIMTTTMMIVTEDQLVEVEGEPRGEEVEEPVRGVPEVEVEVRMRVGRGGLVMVHSPHHSFRSC
jgi:hypothetical protein